MEYRVLTLLFLGLATGALFTKGAEMLFCTFLLISTIYVVAGDLKEDLSGK